MRPLRTLATVLLGLGLVAGCDESKPKIAFQIVTPDGQDTFAGVTRIRLTFGTTTTETTLASAASAFSLSMELTPSQEGQVVLEGLDAEGDLVCRGASPTIFATSTTSLLKLYVARLGTMGRSPGALPTGRVGMAVASYRSENWDADSENDAIAPLLFGGRTQDGTTVASLQYYDAFFHEVYALQDLPAPRSDLIAMNVEDGYFLMFGGRDATGMLTDQLDMARPGDTYPYSTEYDHGLVGAGRARAAAVAFGPFASLFQGADTHVLNAFLMTGGEGPEGTRCDAHFLTARYSTSSFSGWSFGNELRPLAACRLGHTATVVTQDGSGTLDDRVVLVYGGGGEGEPVAEIVRLGITQVDVDTLEWAWSGGPVAEDPGPMITGHTATALADGRVLIVGGVTTDGTVLADAIVFDPKSASFTSLPGLLTVARWGHTAYRYGDELLVAGGTDADGAVLADAEVFDLTAGQPELVASLPLAGPRTGHFAFRLPTGVVGLVGGIDGQGQALTSIEMYTPGLVD